MTEMTTQQKIRSIIAASSGNLVEWFDFYIYAFSAVYFAHNFSTSDNPTIQQINAFGIFAVGFFMRPIGGWLFGSLADKIGRKKSMVFSVTLMAVGSFIIAALPSKDSIGDFAILILLVARLLQGLSVGGETGISSAYLSELGTKGKRGFYSSFQYGTLIGGQFLAVASISVMLLIFNDEQMHSWAWRILFVVGGLLALCSLVVRSIMTESAKDLHKHEDRGTFKALAKSWRSFFIVLGITAGGSLSFYVVTTYTKIFMIESAGFDKSISNDIMFFALLILMFVQPLFGFIGDKIGHRTSLIIFSLLALICTYPAFSFLRSIGSSNATLSFCVILGLCLMLSFYSSVAAVAKAKLFPMHVRALGTGFAHAIPTALFGGTVPYVALQFKQFGFEDGFFIYVAVLVFFMLIAALSMPKTTDLD